MATTTVSIASLLLFLLVLAKQITSVPIYRHEHPHHQSDHLAPHTHTNPLLGGMPDEHEILQPPTRVPISDSPPQQRTNRMNRMRQENKQQQFQHQPNQFRPEMELPAHGRRFNQNQRPPFHPNHNEQRQPQQQQPMNPHFQHPRHDLHHHQQQQVAGGGRHHNCPNGICRPEENNHVMKTYPHHHHQVDQNNFVRENEYHQHQFHVEPQRDHRHQNEYNFHHHHHEHPVHQVRPEMVKNPPREIVPQQTQQSSPQHLTLPITINTMKLIYHPDDARQNEVEDFAFIRPNNINENNKTSISKTAILIIEFDMTDDNDTGEVTVETEEEFDNTI